MNPYENPDNLLKWTLHQYRSGTGRCAITDWRKGFPKGPAQADLDTFLRNMVKMDIWKPPDIEQLKGDLYKEFSELRWKSSGKLQHRIFGRRIGEHQYLMIVGCTHKGDVYNPPGVWDTLVKRNEEIKRGEADYVVYPILTGNRI